LSWLAGGGIVIINVITAMALNNYWSVTQLKVVAGSTLLSYGVVGLFERYAIVKISRDKECEFFLTHYKEGSPLIAEAAALERAAAAVAASPPTRLLERV
jgi:hypothetical protein